MLDKHWTIFDQISHFIVINWVNSCTKDALEFSYHSDILLSTLLPWLTVPLLDSLNIQGFLICTWRIVQSLLKRTARLPFKTCKDLIRIWRQWYTSKTSETVRLMIEVHKFLLKFGKKRDSFMYFRILYILLHLILKRTDLCKSCPQTLKFLTHRNQDFLRNLFPLLCVDISIITWDMTNECLDHCSNLLPRLFLFLLISREVLKQFLVDNRQIKAYLRKYNIC